MDRKCQACPKSFKGRKDAKYCSDACRERARRRRLAAQGSPQSNAAVVAMPGVQPPASAGATSVAPLVAAIEKQLTKAERLDTPAGQMALLLAARLAGGHDTGSAMATLARELKSQMTEALAGATIEPDEFDELAERRLRKVSGA